MTSEVASRDRPNFAIRRAVVALDDAPGLTEFLMHTLDSEKVAQLLATREPGWCGRYGPTSRCADYVVSDGQSATRFVVSDLTEDEAAAIHGACETLVEWTDQTFHNIVNQALGTQYVRAQ
jgi:hypothetical protein